MLEDSNLILRSQIVMHQTHLSLNKSDFAKGSMDKWPCWRQRHNHVSRNLLEVEKHDDSLFPSGERFFHWNLWVRRSDGQESRNLRRQSVKYPYPILTSSNSTLTFCFGTMDMTSFAEDQTCVVPLQAVCLGTR